MIGRLDTELKFRGTVGPEGTEIVGDNRLGLEIVPLHA
jgi:hypothetical protein